MSKHPRTTKLFEPSLVREAVQQSFTKLNPATMFRNPVMFTVEIGTTVMLGVCIWIATGETSQGSLLYNALITAILFITVLLQISPKRLQKHAAKHRQTHCAKREKKHRRKKWQW